MCPCAISNICSNKSKGQGHAARSSVKIGVNLVCLQNTLHTCLSTFQKFPSKSPSQQGISFRRNKLFHIGTTLVKNFQFSKQRLSDKEHDLHGEHNNDYDHDAFLGEDEAKEFDDLSPEESKRRLG